MFVREEKNQSIEQPQIRYIPIQDNERDEVIRLDMKENRKRDQNGTVVLPTLQEEIEYLYISIQIKYRALHCMSTLTSSPFAAYGATVKHVLLAIEAAIDKGITDDTHVKKHQFQLKNTWELYFPTPTVSVRKPNNKKQQEPPNGNNNTSHGNTVRKGRPDQLQCDVNGSSPGQVLLTCQGGASHAGGGIEDA